MPGKGLQGAHTIRVGCLVEVMATFIPLSYSTIVIRSAVVRHGARRMILETFYMCRIGTPLLCSHGDAHLGTGHDDQGAAVGVEVRPGPGGAPVHLEWLHWMVDVLLYHTASHVLRSGTVVVTFKVGPRGHHVAKLGLRNRG